MAIGALLLLMVTTAPPVVATTSPERALATWSAGDVQCAGGTKVSGARVRRPLSTLVWQKAAAQPPVTLNFRIDASGRALSIHRKDERYVSNDDLAPALAASRFPADAREACSVTFSPQVVSFAAGAIGDLVSYTMSPLTGRLPAEGWARIRGPGDCSRAPRPQPLLRAYPDFAKVAGTPGGKDWSLVAYDLDAGGQPVNVRMQAGTGNAQLDEKAVEAVRGSRFSQGVRTGCVYPYWRAPETLGPPPMPSMAEFASSSTCPVAPEWVREPTMRFPLAYRRRQIEGWAVIGYDVAPWGEVGNIRILAAEPAGDFGLQAMQALASAKARPSQQSVTGCIHRVKFAMTPQATDDEDEAAAY